MKICELNQRRWSLALIGSLGTLGVVWAATTSGSGSGGEAVTVVSGGTAIPAPSGAPSSAATASASATSVTTGNGVAEPIPYVLGTMTWHFTGDAPQWKRDQIHDAMNWALNQINTLTNYYGDVPASYDATVPTATANFLGQVRFGGQSTRLAGLHEVNHWLGMGSRAYKAKVVDGKFDGGITLSRVRAYDGSNASISTDGVHFWPYGLNIPPEFRDFHRNIAIVSAQRADIGWGDGTHSIVGERRFQNRSSRMILDAGSSSQALQQPNGTSPTQSWKAGYVDGFVTLTNSDGTLSLDTLGSVVDGSDTAMRPALWWHPNQHWEMIPTDDGWFLLRNRGTGKCLDNLGNQAAGAPMRTWSCGGHPNQQWHLVR